MPQDERTEEQKDQGVKEPRRSPAQKVAFKVMLSNINWLYIGCSVLVLLDLSYLSRFWVRR